MNQINKKKCILKSVNGSHPDIEIANEDDTFVGRTRETGLADTAVSKQHLKIRANFKQKSITIEVLGVNGSALNGAILDRNTEHKALNGDIIEIIPSKYPYKVEFENCNEEEKEEVEMKKRKRSIENDDTAQQCVTNKRIKWQFDIFKDAKSPFPGDNLWESFNKSQLLVYTTPECKPSNKIAAYDMDGTLIATKSGKVFPTNIDDWKLAFGSVVGTLKSKHQDKYKIVIFTNQAGISSGKTILPNIKKKIENIVKVLSVPVQAFIATGDNFFRKPLTGMWQTLCEQKNDGISIDIDECLFVGDAAGRPENKLLKKKKDHSCVDRLLAINLNLKFLTPEEHFLKSPAQKWIRPEFNPKSISDNDANSSPLNLSFTGKTEVILLVGSPGSGKSHFCKTHLETRDYEVVSRDAIGSWQKCVDKVNDCLRRNRKVVVDNTNGDKESRSRYINAAKKHKIPCRCFVMTTSFKHAEHNIAFRELIDTKHSKISKIVLNSYKKHYQEPLLEEGFTEIVRVNFIPKFDDDRQKSLYELYLLSS